MKGRPRSSASRRSRRVWPSSSRFIDNDPELASYLRIEERELEAGGVNQRLVICKRGVPASVTHLALAVSDQARSTRFYVDYFGFVAEPEPREDGVLVLHDRSGFSLALGEIDEPVVVPPFLHFGRSAVNPDDVRSFRDRIEADGLDIVEWWEEPDYVSVKFRDPDGYVIEVGWDAAGSPR